MFQHFGQMFEHVRFEVVSVPRLARVVAIHMVSAASRFSMPEIDGSGTNTTHDTETDSDHADTGARSARGEA